MSLRDEWYAARAQRQQEIQFRQQQVLEHRHQTQMNLSATATNRAAMSAAMWDSLHTFHSTLQSSMANFQEDTRAYQQQVWMDQQNQRAAYVAAMRDYVWGAAPAFIGDASFGKSVSPLPAPKLGKLI
ncbi:MAG: hypothetical protein KME26_29000 [Oscillatoria princeps RMCB-10]|nr:hypothetical protein [Oscillatoria princeps RMCB-10]